MYPANTKAKKAGKLPTFRMTLRTCKNLFLNNGNEKSGKNC